MQPATIKRGEGQVFGSPKTALPDLLCFSHLRWNHVYQHPQRLMTRWAHDRRVFFIEEPLFTASVTDRTWSGRDAQLIIKAQDEHLVLVTPQLPCGLTQMACAATLGRLVDKLMVSYRISDYLLWYYTTMALGYTRHLSPRGVLYDCLGDCLSDRPPTLLDLTPSPYAHPLEPEPADQARIARPRLGCFGVIDDRIDWQLIEGLALARPQWQLVFCGPLPAIDRARLPNRPNIHYLGGKSYGELATYLPGWDVAMLPFSPDNARPLEPNRTAENLAAGRPVVSTRVSEIVHTYGQSGLVRIADTLPEFIAAVEQSLCQGSAARLPRETYRLQEPLSMQRLSLA